MSYLFREKLNIEDLSGRAPQPKRVLLFEPEQDLAEVYLLHLSDHDFYIRLCPDLGEIKQVAIDFSPEILIFRADTPYPAASARNLFRSLATGLPNLRVITTGYNLTSEEVRELMSAGVASHINRALSRPQDLALVIKTVLTN